MTTPQTTTNQLGYTYELDGEEHKNFQVPYKTCALLWSHVSNEPGGTCRTCCIAKDRIKDKNGNEMNLATSTLTEVLQSEFVKEIRDELREGGEPANCETCWIDERNGKESKRIQYNQYWNNFYGDQHTVWDQEPTKVIDAQLIFDNTCNLKCRSCNTNYSSKWREEAIDRGVPFWEPSDEVDMMDPEKSKFWTEIDNWTNDILRLEIMGGEPFYMKQFREFARMLIEKKTSQRISLTLSTNGTIANTELLESMAANFKDLAFSVSIDGIEDRFTYLRHPGDWEVTKANLDYYYELHVNKSYPVNVQITHTVTALNVMYLPEFYDYFRNRWPQFKIWNNIAHYPKWLTCAVLPNFAKKQITANLKEHDFGVFDYSGDYCDYNKEIDSLIDYMNTPLFQNGESVPGDIRGRLTKDKLQEMDNRRIEKKYITFKKQIAGGDRYRQENFTEVFPELHELIKDSFDYEKETDTVSRDGFKPISAEEYG
jgi:organic radical activating enzyme